VSVRLPAGTVTDAAAVEVALDDVAPEQVVSGAPQAGYTALDESDAGELGVWEMTPGVATDVEADELFVVVGGRATVAFTEPALPSIELGPGSIIRLEAGMRTTWTVHETLRKVYLAP
jgi:uncharacterized protein